MKNITSDFKQELTRIGKQQNITIVNKTTMETIDNEDIFNLSVITNGQLFKSCMRYIELTTTKSFNKNDTLTINYGLLVNNNFEYINIGDFIITEIEEKKDDNTYTLKAYDLLVKSMVKYEGINQTFPLSVKDYILGMCNNLDLQFASYSDNFVNANTMINYDPYEGLNYTYRDILDELSQITASSICINNSQQLEVRYINNTFDVIDENYLKDTNVSVGEKFGVVNSLVFSRSADSDNIYRQDTTSIEENGLCEIKFSDNQLLNGNNRDNFIDEVFFKINGLYYYTYDFSSTGIMYYDYLDCFTTQINGNNYKCVVINDEQEITQGLEENLYCEMPLETQTDYTKADKTDRKINQTTLIVDKQNQTIEGLITQQSDTESKIVKIQADINELRSEISNVADITTYVENFNYLSVDKINMSEPIFFSVDAKVETIPIGTKVYFCKKGDSNALYPSLNLYPSSYLFPGKWASVVEYELPTTLNYTNTNVYDEFHIDYETHRCFAYHNELRREHGMDWIHTTIEEFDYPTIELDDGDYYITLNPSYDCYLKGRFMIQNIYTDQFATNVEMKSAISQTAQEINLSVDQKLENYSTTEETRAEISVKANEINSEVSKKVGKDEVISRINQTAETIKIQAEKLALDGGKVIDLLAGNQINLSSKNISINSNNFRVDSNGNLNCSNANISGYINATSGNFSGTINATDGNFRGNVYCNNGQSITIYNSSGSRSTTIGSNGISVYNSSGTQGGNITTGYQNWGSSQIYGVKIAGPSRSNNFLLIGDLAVFTPNMMVASAYANLSKEELKENINKFDDSALKEILNTDVYNFNYKDDISKEKKIGFIIGENYNLSDKINNGNAVDLYSSIGLLFKAIQEQQEQINNLKKEIELLKGGK